MGQTCTFLRYHIVFGTKERREWIRDGDMDALRKYLAGILRNINGHLIYANGATDHVHLLADLPPTLSLSDGLRTIKANSSRWIRSTWNHADQFAWQTGYGAFTVSRSLTDDVYTYIENQREHHRKLTFLEELKMLYDRHGIAYDERYL